MNDNARLTHVSRCMLECANADVISRVLSEYGTAALDDPRDCEEFAVLFLEQLSALCLSELNPQGIRLDPSHFRTWTAIFETVFSKTDVGTNLGSYGLGRESPLFHAIANLHDILLHVVGNSHVPLLHAKLPLELGGAGRGGGGEGGQPLSSSSSNGDDAQNTHSLHVEWNAVQVLVWLLCDGAMWRTLWFLGSTRGWRTDTSAVTFVTACFRLDNFLARCRLWDVCTRRWGVDDIHDAGTLRSALMQVKFRLMWMYTTPFRPQLPDVACACYMFASELRLCYLRLSASEFQRLFDWLREDMDRCSANPPSTHYTEYHRDDVHIGNRCHDFACMETQFEMLSRAICLLAELIWGDLSLSTFVLSETGLDSTDSLLEEMCPVMKLFADLLCDSRTDSIPGGCSELYRLVPTHLASLDRNVRYQLTHRLIKYLALNDRSISTVRRKQNIYLVSRMYELIVDSTRALPSSVPYFRYVLESFVAYVDSTTQRGCVQLNHFNFDDFALYFSCMGLSETDCVLRHVEEGCAFRRTMLLSEGGSGDGSTRGGDEEAERLKTAVREVTYCNRWVGAVESIVKMGAVQMGRHNVMLNLARILLAYGLHEDEWLRETSPQPSLPSLLSTASALSASGLSPIGVPRQVAESLSRIGRLNRKFQCMLWDVKLATFLIWLGLSKDLVHELFFCDGQMYVCGFGRT